MKTNMRFLKTALFVMATAIIPALISRADHAPRAVLPDAVVDLRTTEGVAHLGAQWRFSDTQVQQVQRRDVGADLKPSGPENHTYDFTPDARAADFDDSKWESIPANSLETRRGHGWLSFVWYRLNVTVPEKVAAFDTRGSTVVFEIVMDDYSEIWVNGKGSFVQGQAGGAAVSGWNAPNRVVLAKSAQPGQKFQIAVLAINGPVSAHPEN
jgi:gluconolactonase